MARVGQALLVKRGMLTLIGQIAFALLHILQYLWARIREQHLTIQQYWTDAQNLHTSLSLRISVFSFGSIQSTLDACIGQHQCPHQGVTKGAKRTSSVYQAKLNLRGLLRRVRPASESSQRRCDSSLKFHRFKQLCKYFPFMRTIGIIISVRIQVWSIRR